MSELIPSLGCLFLLFLGLPIWAIREARNAKQRQGLLEGKLDDFSDRLRSLEGRLLELKRQIRLGATAPATEEAEADTVGPIVASTPPPAAISSTVDIPAAPDPPPAPPIVTPPAPPAPPEIPLPNLGASASPPPHAFDWESLISVRLFAWLGGAALFLGAALFFQYAIQHGLISPAMRVAIGLIVGSAALAWGDSGRVRSMWAAQAASGAGVAVLYASFFAAHARYGLLGQPATFAAMALVTIVAGLLSVRRQSTILAVLGTVGGFLTPFLLATEEDHPIGLFFYVAALDVGLLAVARARRWFWLPLLGLGGTALLYVGWASRHLDSMKLPFALAAAILLSALFILGLGKRIAGEIDEHGRTTRAIAAIAPFLVALVTAGDSKLALSPIVLVADLLVLIGLAFFVARETDADALVPIAATMAMLSLVFRAGSDLFPSQRVETLIIYVLVPLALFFGWLWRGKSSANGPVYRMGAAIGLFGTYVILARVLDVEHGREPALPPWLFVAVGAAGLVAIGILVRAGGWILSAQALMLLALLTLATRFDSSRLPEFLPLILIPGVVFWALPFVAPRGHPDRVAWFSAGLAPVAAFGALYVLARPTWGTDRLGIASIVLGALSFVALRRTLTLEAGDPEERRFTTAVFGGVTLLFLTAAIPILLDKQWITVAWALEAAALAWLSQRIGEPALGKVATALASAVFGRLVLNPFLWRYHPRSDTPIFNWYLYTFGVPAIALLAAAHWLRNDEEARACERPISSASSPASSSSSS